MNRTEAEYAAHLEVQRRAGLVLFGGPATGDGATAGVRVGYDRDPGLVFVDRDGAVDLAIGSPGADGGAAAGLPHFVKMYFETTPV